VKTILCAPLSINGKYGMPGLNFTSISIFLILFIDEEYVSFLKKATNSSFVISQLFPLKLVVLAILGHKPIKINEADNINKKLNPNKSIEPITNKTIPTTIKIINNGT